MVQNAIEMKKILFLSIIFLKTNLYCQSMINCQETRNEKNLSEVIEWFIIKINNEYINNLKYVVYVIHGYESDISSDSMCFSLSYILNSFEYKSVNPSHYFVVNDEIVLVRLGKNFNPDILGELELKKIEPQDEEIIIKKLFPQEMGGITGIVQGLIYCQSGNKITKTFYENTDEIPIEKSIYKSIPPGTQEIIK